MSISNTGLLLTQSTPGYVLICPALEDRAILLNPEGEVAHEWHFTELGLEEHPLYRNGNRWSYGRTNTILPLGDGSYLVSSKNLNLLFIIDSLTDTIKWKYQNDEMGGQRDAQMLDNGNIIIFANGLCGGDLSHSQVWEINPKTHEIV